MGCFLEKSMEISLVLLIVSICSASCLASSQVLLRASMWIILLLFSLQPPPFCQALVLALLHSSDHTLKFNSTHFPWYHPSIFLGAPEADTALAVLPGHALLMEGRGEEAVRLSAIGSARSGHSIAIDGLTYDVFLQEHIWPGHDYVWWDTCFDRARHDRYWKWWNMRRTGSLVHLKYKFYALLSFYFRVPWHILHLTTPYRCSTHQNSASFNSLAPSFRIVRRFPCL